MHQVLSNLGFVTKRPGLRPQSALRGGLIFPINGHRTVLGLSLNQIDSLLTQCAAKAPFWIAIERSQPTSSPSDRRLWRINLQYTTSRPSPFRDASGAIERASRSSDLPAAARGCGNERRGPRARRFHPSTDAGRIHFRQTGR